MKKSYQILATLFFVLFSIACVLPSCGSIIGDAPENSDVPTNATEFRQFYSTHVTMEINDSEFYKAYEASYASGFQTIIEQNKVAEKCTSDYTTLVQEAMAGRFSPVGSDGTTPSSGINAQIAIDVYAPTEGYPGDPAICQGLMDKLFTSIENWRKNNVDLIKQVYDRTAVRRIHLNDDIYKTGIQDIARIASDTAKENGYPYFSKFIFPTYNLQVPSHSKELCDLYTDWATDPNKTGLGYIKPDDWNPVYKTCTLRGLAADEYMDKVMMPSDVAAMFDTGEEVSPLDSLNP